jgi:hypothetical protein
LVLQIDSICAGRGVFPDPAALLRLAGAVLVEAHDERQVSERRYLSEGSWPCSPPQYLIRRR